MRSKEDVIQEMFRRVLEFVPDGRCPYCGADVLRGVVINEKTPIITKCPNIMCNRSYLD